MMEETGRFEHDFKDQVDQRGNSEKNNHEEPKRDRKKNLTEMKARGGAHIEVEIGVMDVVKTPEQGNAMSRIMPPVVGPIHQEECDDGSDKPWQFDPIEQSNPIVLSPEGV